MTDKKPVPVIRLLSLVLLMLILSSEAYSDSERGIDCLLQAYPGFLIEKDGDNLILADGHRLPYGSGSQGNFEDRLDHADLHDQMSQCYSPGFPVDQPRFNEDPGRMRHEPFFKRLYGEDKLAVQRNIVQVSWAPTGKSLAFSRIAGADQALIRVGNAIASRPELRHLVSSPMGTLNWRTIQGTKRTSTHSFGIAIDFRLPHGLGHYWRWAGCLSEKSCAYPERVLQDRALRDIVTIFEANGFIWGGKWFHFDTIHFEYRPELLVAECTCKSQEK